MKAFSIAVLISAIVPIFIASSPFILINLKNNKETYMKYLGFLLLTIFVTLVYLKKRYEFAGHKNRIRRLNHKKVIYNSKKVNKGFGGMA